MCPRKEVRARRTCPVTLRARTITLLEKPGRERSAKKSDLGRTLRPNRAPWSGPLRHFYRLNDHEIFVTVQSRPVLMSIEIPSSLSLTP